MGERYGAYCNGSQTEPLSSSVILNHCDCNGTSMMDSDARELSREHICILTLSIKYIYKNFTFLLVARQLQMLGHQITMSLLELIFVWNCPPLNGLVISPRVFDQIALKCF
jgi:hypothetical protein